MTRFYWIFSNDFSQLRDVTGFYWVFEAIYFCVSLGATELKWVSCCFLSPDLELATCEVEEYATTSTLPSLFIRRRRSCTGEQNPWETLRKTDGLRVSRRIRFVFVFVFLFLFHPFQHRHRQVWRWNANYVGLISVSHKIKKCPPHRPRSPLVLAGDGKGHQRTGKVVLSN